MSNQWQSADFNFSNGLVKCFFNIPLAEIENQIDADKIIWVTDENIYQKYPQFFPAGRSIILHSGEQFKNMETVSTVIDELLLMEADRDVYVVGVGGGIVTDISGFLASIYLRGVKFSFVPTSILAMVDAAVGGKNGVNFGLYKNQVGVVNQPESLFFDFEFLKTLPDIEWVSGFAEIIKHACIRDAEMFQFLANNSIEDFRKDLNVTGDLVRKNAELKFSVASGDEKESGQRRLLNFGHTIGHAIENLTQLPHGFAIGVGMKYACLLSERLAGFPPEKTKLVTDLLAKYHLPVDVPFDKNAAWDILVHDKKKSGDSLYFILLDDIGSGIVKKLPLAELKSLFFDL